MPMWYTEYTWILCTMNDETQNLIYFFLSLFIHHYNDTIYLDESRHRRILRNENKNMSPTSIPLGIDGYKKTFFFPNWILDEEKNEKKMLNYYVWKYRSSWNYIMNNNNFRHCFSMDTALKAKHVFIIHIAIALRQIFIIIIPVLSWFMLSLIAVSKQIELFF